MGAVLSQSNEIGEVYIEQHVDALLENPPISFPAILFLSYPKSKSLVVLLSIRFKICCNYIQLYLLLLKC